MKLRYYMRGIGICMIITTLLLGGAGDNKETLTDEEIKIRAAQLGMVEEKAVVLSDLKAQETVEAKQETGEEIPETGEEMQGTDETIPEESVAEFENIPETSEQVEAAEEEVVEATEGSTVTLVIKSGASSASVSSDLVRAGLVSDADEFDRYLCSNGYDKVIRIGTYEIPVGSSEEEIAKIITGKR